MLSGGGGETRALRSGGAMFSVSANTKVSVKAKVRTGESRNNYGMAFLFRPLSATMLIITDLVIDLFLTLTLRILPGLQP